MRSELEYQNWQESNRRYLSSSLLAVREALNLHEAKRDGDTGKIIDAHRRWEEACTAVKESEKSLPSSSALDMLCSAFNLSSFERDLLLLCADVELDSSYFNLDFQEISRYPTFSLALSSLPGAHWSALSPNGPLRRWNLIEIGPGDTLTSSPLRINERILHYLAGVSYLDQNLSAILEMVHVQDELVPSHITIADRMAGIWSGEPGPEYPLIMICGDDHSEKMDIAALASEELGVSLYTIAGSDIPQSPVERENLVRTWERESILGGVALIVDCDLEEAGRAQISFLEALSSLTMVTSAKPISIKRRSIVRFDVERPGAGESLVLWHKELGSLALELGQSLRNVASSFDFNRQTIQAVSSDVKAAQSLGRSDLESVLWDSCRSQSKPQLGELAQRIIPMATWDDLVLPKEQLSILQDLSNQVKNRSLVYEDWGFASHNNRGLGISALFAGDSGTGKTMAAEVLANDLKLDLYRIDLSQVVSKYIGETEKNLKKVFDSAEDSGAILLFDEADALFGKRSEVKDSHDRYANIEIGYLLQRVEAYRGLAILTTNLKDSLDKSFLRRIRFVVSFPFPDASRREDIWKRIFPKETPLEDLDYKKLANLNVAGGNIKNIAMYAAFLAADEGKSINLDHLVRAAKIEYSKMERPLSRSEFGGKR